MKQRMIGYITEHGVTHNLDSATSVEQDFLEKFEAVILKPRGLEYKVQFTGPTGTNAVKAALKLARKFSRHPTVIHF